MQPESDKWGWKHVSVFGGFEKGSGTKRWKCNHCNLRYNGSYSRVRAHLLGFSGNGVKSCHAIDGSLREAFQVLEEERLARKSKRAPRSEKHGAPRSEKHGAPRSEKRVRTSRPSNPINKEEVDDAVARFFYANGLNFNIVSSPYFREMTKTTALYGSRYQPPAVSELSDSFLTKEKARIERSMVLVKESWPQTGCSILCVGRLESRLGCFHINIFISCPRGLVFLKAVDIADVDGAENRFSGVLGDLIAEVGPENVLQIVSHLDHANQLSDSLVLEKFPHIFLSRCTSHSVYMLMEEIAEMDWIKAVAISAKEIEQCITAYQKVFPTAFLQIIEGSTDTVASKLMPFFCIVQRVLELKQPLKEAVVSDEWKKWKLDTTKDTAEVEVTILDDSYWGNAEFLLQLFEPFVRLLGTLHIDRFVMGDICNWRVQALEDVRSKGLYGVRLNQLEELIANRWDALFSPLHAAGYILNPRHFGKGQAKDKTVMKGWKATLERYENESASRRILREQLSSYWRSEGSFGDEDAVDCRDKMDPVAWWENFGFETPLLQTLAIKILSQVSCVTMCKELCQDDGITCREAAFRLGVERVEDLVFVQNNLRIHCQKNGMSCPPSGPNVVSYAQLPM